MPDTPLFLTASSYDGHSNFGIGMAFSKNLPGIQGFMKLGEDLICIDWLYLRNNQGHPGLAIDAETEYGDDITTTSERYDPLWGGKCLYGYHENLVYDSDPIHRPVFNIFLSQPPGGSAVLTNLHIVRPDPLMPWKDYHLFPKAPNVRNIIVKGGAADMPAKNWNKLFMNACTSGPYYLRTLNHGTLFYTTQECSDSGTTTAYVKTIVDGKGDEDIYISIKDAEPGARHDYRIF